MILSYPSFPFPHKITLNDMTKIFKINHLKSRFNNIIYLIFLIIIVSHLKQIISVETKPNSTSVTAHERDTLGLF